MARVKIGNVRTPIDYLKQFFAPAGYGLGVQNGHDCTDCNAAILNGVYYLFGESAQNHPGHSMQYGCLVVYRRGSYITQVIHYDYFEAKRYSKDGGNTWGEWEWVNPPMNPGVEYRTTERFRGVPVYTMLVECGTTVAGTTQKAVPFAGLPIRYTACAGGTVSPYRPNDGDVYRFEVFVDGTNITLTVGSGEANKPAYVQVWYTK